MAGDIGLAEKYIWQALRRKPSAVQSASKPADSGITPPPMLAERGGRDTRDLQLWKHFELPLLEQVYVYVQQRLPSRLLVMCSLMPSFQRILPISRRSVYQEFSRVMFCSMHNFVSY